MGLCHIHVNKQKLKVLVIPDVHLKCTNPKNRKKYPEEILEYMEHILKLVEVEEVDIVIFLGDIYHDEFVGKLSGKYGQELIGIVNAMKSSGTRVFTLMGNHELHTFSKGCPFFDNIDYRSERIMQELLAKQIRLPKYPVPTWETCDRLIINDSICFDMHHFSDIDKSYLTEPNDYKEVVKLVHDAILPSHARKHINTITEVDLGRYTKVVYNDEMFVNCTYAVLGDIHTKIGEMTVTTSTGDVLADIPGSIGRVTSGIAESHESVDIPLFVIDGNNLTKTHIPFKLWSIKDSFKLAIVEENKKAYADMKDLKSNLESVEVRKTFQEDLETFPNYAQTILYEIRDKSHYTPKTKYKVRTFLGKRA